MPIAVKYVTIQTSPDFSNTIVALAQSETKSNKHRHAFASVCVSFYCPASLRSAPAPLRSADSALVRIQRMLTSAEPKKIKKT